MFIDAVDICQHERIPRNAQMLSCTYRLRETMAQLNAQMSRDLRLKSTRVLTFQVNASNLLNMVNYSAIDTIVNSPTFGQVLAVRPMRSMQANLRFRF